MRENQFARRTARAVWKFREVLECGSPLPLFPAWLATTSGRGLPQSKTLARGSLTNFALMVGVVRRLKYSYEFLPLRGGKVLERLAYGRGDGRQDTLFWHQNF